MVQFATVYQARARPPHNEIFNQIVAVKVMEMNKLTQEDKDALEVEIKAMQILGQHEGFVKIYEYFQERDKIYLVIEFLEGGELFNKIAELEKYTEADARNVVIQMSRALSFAHNQRVAHRDLKPENILLRSKEDNTSIKLADLGFAKVLAPGVDLMTTACGCVRARARARAWVVARRRGQIHACAGPDGAARRRCGGGERVCPCYTVAYCMQGTVRPALIPP